MHLKITQGSLGGPFMSVRSLRVFAQSLIASRVLVFSFLLAVAFPTVAQAQTGDESYWGVNGSYTPRWELMKPLRDALFEGDDVEGTLEGSEFTIGFVRGSTFGGDWGVSFVRKPFKDGSGGNETSVQCFNQAQTQCATETTSTLTEGVYLNGVEVHWFIAFGTIKDRVQIGLNVGGGIARVNGNVVETRDGFRPVNFNPFTLEPFHEVETLSAQEELLTIFPLVKLEAQGAVIVTPAFKVKVGGGLNFPGLAFRVGGTYLFGAQ
jgi:hypothetical protein